MRATLRLAALTLCLRRFWRRSSPPPRQPAAAAAAAHRTPSGPTRSSAKGTASSARCRAAWRRWWRRRSAAGASPTATCSARKAAAPSWSACATATASSTPRMPATAACSGKAPRSASTTGGEGARTMMLVYNLPATDAIYQRFAGIDGSAYFIGGFGMTALASGQHHRGADPLRRRPAARRQYRLSQVYAAGDLEPVLRRRRSQLMRISRPDTGTQAPGLG